MDYLEIRFKTLLEDFKMNYKAGINLNPYHVNEETIEVNLTGSAGYLKPCSFKAPNIEIAISNSTVKYMRLFYTATT